VAVIIVDDFKYFHLIELQILPDVYYNLSMYNFVLCCTAEDFISKYMAHV